MAFITNGVGNVISFAEYTDVLQKDQRLLEANEIVVPAESGFADKTEFVEDMLEKSTNRMLLKIKAGSWWTAYNNYVGNPISNLNDLPNVNPNLIDPGNKIGRQQQFTDAAVYHCLAQYLLPLIADFGNEESSTFQKINYYDAKFNDLYNELISIADWYDFDNSGTIDADEKALSFFQTRRTRRKPGLVKVR